MKKKIAIVMLSAGCLVVPTCLDAGAFGISDVGLNVCFPGQGLLNVCADVDTPVDFGDFFGGEE